MIYFTSDYCEGAHPNVLERLISTNLEQTVGYGEDPYCLAAARMIRDKCGRQDADVHFLVGGTQTNLTLISAALRPHQGAIAAVTGHINVHESGAIEATGHKVLALPSSDGKLTAGQIRAAVDAHVQDATHEHMVQPKLVYISNPTELGSIYSKAELTAISETCREKGLFLYLDGARLGSAICAEDNDLDLRDIAALCGAFTIGGTKSGALFGEALVLCDERLKPDFRYIIKQKGGMLAKGRLLGLQFIALLENDLYFALASHANQMAMRIRDACAEKGIPFLIPSTTNQQFPILLNDILKRIGEKFCFEVWNAVDDRHSAVRFCTSWATEESAVRQLIAEIRRTDG